MEATIKTTNLGNLDRDLDIKSLEEGMKTLTLSDGGHNYVIFWNGHEFEANRVTISFRRRLTIGHDYTANDLSIETASAYYFPLDPRATVSDWRRAIKAVPNEDNSGWLPEWDEDYHHDHELRLKAAVTTAFDEQVAKADKAALDAVYDALLVNDHGNQRAVFYYTRTADDLKRFREDVKAAIVAEAHSRHLGYYHQNPHEAHVHAPLERAIRAVMAEQVAAKGVGPLDRWTPISTYVNGVLAEVVKKHEYETRWGQAARLEAEAKAAAAAAEAAEPAGE